MQAVLEKITALQFARFKDLPNQDRLTTLGASNWRGGCALAGIHHYGCGNIEFFG
jgi:hypothetical protein